MVGLTTADVLSIVFILLNAAVLVVQYLLNRKMNMLRRLVVNHLLPAMSVEEEDARLARH